MYKNIKRRISLYPDSLNKFQNPLKRIKEKDLSEKADLDTFNKISINKKTPKKEKKLNKDILQSPIIEKEKYRKISIYSPISFGDISTPLNDKKITDFNNQILLSEDNLDFNDFDNIICPFKKFKKIDNKNKKNIKYNDNIVFTNNKNENIKFSLYKDYDIYGKNDIIKKYNSFINDNENFKNKNNNLCLINLEEGINYINKHPEYLSQIINRKKYL